MAEIGPASQNDRIYPDLGMFGAYPGPSSFTKVLYNTNTKQLIQEKKPLPHGEDRPGYSDLEKVKAAKTQVETSSGTFLRDVTKDGDIWQCFYGSTPAGFGDPIKRDPALAKKDLDNGLLTIESCRQIYCIEAQYDNKTEEWVIDEKKTADLRNNRRKERLAKGVTGEQWWKARRQDLVDNRMPQLIKNMYNDSLSKGKNWSQDYRDFWGLEKDFTFKES